MWRPLGSIPSDRLELRHRNRSFVSPPCVDLIHEFLYHSWTPGWFWSSSSPCGSQGCVGLSYSICPAMGMVDACIDRDLFRTRITIVCFLDEQHPPRQHTNMIKQSWLIRNGHCDDAKESLRRTTSREITGERIEMIIAKMAYSSKRENKASKHATYLNCVRGINLRRTEKRVSRSQ